MSVVWSIVRASGATQTFEAVGIGNVTRRLVNQGVDTAEVLLSRSDVFTAPPWSYGETVQIKRDALVWFRGRLTAARPSASGGSESLTLTLSGAWWYLDQIVYTQPARFVLDPLANPTPAGAQLTIEDFETAEQVSSSVFVGQDQEGTKVSTDDMIRDALTYAISKGALLQLGTIDSGVDIPRESLSAVTCGEIVRRSLRWTPDQLTWFDYTTNPPTFHCRKRSNRAAKIFPIADRNVTVVSLNERRDLLLPGVRIEYLREHERDGFRFRTQDVDEAGDGTALGALIVPVMLYGSFLANGSLVDPEPIPSGIAQTLYDAYSGVPWEGRISLVNEDCPADHWTAKTAKVTGGNPAWASMTADIQEAVDTTASGRSELTLGPPRHLGPADLIGLLRAGRTQPPPFAELLARATGGGPATGTIPSGSDDPRLQFGGTQPDLAIFAHRFLLPGGGDTFFYDIVRDSSPTGPIVLTASGLTVGQIVIVSNVSIGRGKNKEEGLVAGFQDTFVVYPDGTWE